MDLREIHVPDVGRIVVVTDLPSRPFMALDLERFPRFDCGDCGDVRMPSVVQMLLAYSRFEWINFDEGRDFLTVHDVWTGETMRGNRAHSNLETVTDSRTRAYTQHTHTHTDEIRTTRMIRAR